ncbi:MAG: WcaI family glycosyltransferase [Cytophagales bacterium]|nr:WcaI family glycosyltransferase [Cytophaga sp.]
MKILIYGINYTPDLTGIGKYTGEMGAWLARKGHEVEAITAVPYYPKWNVDPAYKGKLWHTETIAGVKVRRCPLYVPSKVTGSSRMVHEFSFFLSSAIFWLKAFFKKYDVIITPYPPLVIGFWPWIYKIIHPKATWVFHIQDLQVDAARELGLIKNKKFLSALQKTESFWLRKADYISSISEGMKQRILKKGIPENKYIMLPNWAETHIITPLTKEQSMRDELGITKETKVILYSGNLGEKQGVDIIVDAAHELRAMTNVVFLIAGEGAFKERLESYAAEQDVKNVRFLSLQPYHKLASFLATADLHLVVQKRSAGDLVLPSKFMSILSAGGIALVTTEKNTSLYNMIQVHETAYMCEPENLAVFTNMLQTILLKDSSEMSLRARTYAEEHLSIDAVLSAFEKRLMM